MLLSPTVQAGMPDSLLRARPMHLGPLMDAMSRLRDRSVGREGVIHAAGSVVDRNLYALHAERASVEGPYAGVIGGERRG